jgi:hypothetical protein
MHNQSSEDFGNVPHAAERFGTFPQSSEGFGKLRKASEDFGNLPNDSERTEHHTLTVREVARLFENAAVPRTERSIINWCQPNRQGVSRLDSFFDTNERKYFITGESVTRAIEEEKSKLTMGSGETSTSTSDMRKASEEPGQSNAEEKIRHDSKHQHDTLDTDETASLELKVRDLEITNRAKDYFIEQLQKERDSFNDERQKYVTNLMSFSRKVGELETQLRQLGAVSRSNELPQGSEVIREEEVWKNSEDMNV